MKKTKLTKTAALFSLSILTLTSCGSGIPDDWAEGVSWVSTHSQETAYNSLAEKARKSTYTTVETYFPNSWNTATTFQAENGKILTNLVDGLLAVDEYNKLVPELASEVPSVSNGGIKEVEGKYQVTFTIREGANWVKNSGWGNEVVEPVKGEDFVTAMKINLDYSSLSESNYMTAMFIEGANEYLSYTQLVYFSEHGYGTIDKTKVEAAQAAGTDVGVCASNIGGVGSPTGACKDYIVPFPTEAQDKAAYRTWLASNLGVAESELDSIGNFSRVGVKADGNKVTYSLTGKQEYFLSVTTYTPFLPVPTQFYNADPVSYGTTARDILSCGAYVVDNSFDGNTSNELILNKSMSYVGKDSVKNARIVIKKTPNDTDSTTARKLFENGEIDGFTVQKADEAGWKKYVTGEDGTGTASDPANELAFSNESLGDGSTFAYMLNTNRTTWKGSMFDTASTHKVSINNNANNTTIDSSTGLPTAILNTNIALSYSPKLRKAILTALDYPTYFKYRTLSNDSYEDRKSAVNTWTPHDFVIVDDGKAANGGNDYLDFLQEEYANTILLGDERETATTKTVAELLKGSEEEKAYGNLLFTAAEEALEQSSFGGLALIPEYSTETGKFTGFKKAAEGTTYATAVGSDTTDSGFGTGAVISNKSVEGTSETWYASASRDTDYISQLVTEGIAEAEANYKAATGLDYKVQTPILIEYPTLEYNDEMNREAAAVINQTNANLNGGKYIKESDDIPEQNRAVGIGSSVLNDNSKSINYSDAKVVLLHSTKGNIPDNIAYSSVASSYNYSMVISGWGPDYSDPKTYADTLKINGDMQGAIGTGAQTQQEITRVSQYVTYEYDDLVAAADDETSNVKRAQGYAKAEIQMLYDNSLIRPVYMAGQGLNVSVRKTLPKGVTSLTWGLSSYKYKGIEVFDEALSGELLQQVLAQLKEVRNA